MRTTLIMLFTLLALPACSLYPSRPLQPALHDFGPARPAAAPGSAGVIAIEAPIWMRDERIRYRLLYARPTEVNYYAMDAWIAPPSALLANRWAGMLSQNTHRLKIALSEFEQRFTSSASAYVVVALDLQAQDADGKLVGNRTLRIELPCPSPDAKGAVSAYAVAVEQAETELRSWLSSLP